MAQNYDDEERINLKEKTKKEEKKQGEDKKDTNSQVDYGETSQIENKLKLQLRDEIPNLKRLEKNVLQYIIGQDAQVKRIITSIYRSIKFKTIKSNVLIIGPSGTGKTETIKQIAKKLNLPYTIEDATKYTKEGYYGGDVIDIIYNLIENADYDIEKAEHGIIVIDEIDKKVSNEQEDISGTDVLKSLLKIIEGTKIKIDIPECFEIEDFNTENLIIIFSGAFIGLDKIRNERIHKKHMGFLETETDKETDTKRNYIKEDLVKYGLIDEFVGRIDTIIEMNQLTKENLVDILKTSKLSIFRKYKNELKKLGVKLYYKRDLYERIAEKCVNLSTGARELSNVVNNIFENIIYEVLSEPKKYHKCVLDSEIVEDNTKYKLS